MVWQALSFMIDTGATNVVLTPKDAAERMGYDLASKLELLAGSRRPPMVCARGAHRDSRISSRQHRGTRSAGHGE